MLDALTELLSAFSSLIPVLNTLPHYMILSPSTFACINIITHARVPFGASPPAYELVKAGTMSAIPPSTVGT